MVTLPNIFINFRLHKSSPQGNNHTTLQYGTEFEDGALLTIQQVNMIFKTTEQHFLFRSKVCCMEASVSLMEGSSTFKHWRIIHMPSGLSKLKNLRMTIHNFETTGLSTLAVTRHWSRMRIWRGTKSFPKTHRITGSWTDWLRRERRTQPAWPLSP